MEGRGRNGTGRETGRKRGRRKEGRRGREESEERGEGKRKKKRNTIGTTMHKFRLQYNALPIGLSLFWGTNMAKTGHPKQAIMRGNQKNNKHKFMCNVVPYL